jgi:hypothetical protein
MSKEWKYQLRIRLSDKMAEVARRNPDDPAIKPLADVLKMHGARLQNQFDAFVSYVEEAKENGTENYPLYRWTKATIEDPVKKAKYTKAFTLYVDGDEVYAKEKADLLELVLEPLVGGAIVKSMSRHDTNPANNPQPPKQHRS